MKRTLPQAIACALALLCTLPGCKYLRKPSEPTPSPTPPKPTPTPGIYVPAKSMETSKLFSGIRIRATVETENGTTAKAERAEPSSYMLDLQLKVKVPKPHSDLKELCKLNENLPKVLPWLEASLPQAKVSQFYDDFYRLKVNSLKHDLVRLDQLLSRQHFFDCETVLQLHNGASKRRALLIQASMDVDTDGSDSDRVPVIEGASSTFQPMTSYKWPKKTDRPNPFLAGSAERLRRYEQELASRTANADRSRDLRDDLIPDARYEVNQLKKSSFLVAATDPFIVLPGTLMAPEYDPYAPKIGDYCVVICKNMLYPAIVGDAGPNYKIGEASLRICKEINALSNGNNRPMSELKITYLVFPNSADRPFAAPDLDKWHERCEQLLAEMGGYNGELKAWEDLTKPKPTPTPSPSPLPSPSPGTSASPAATGTSAPTVTPRASVSPKAAPSASVSASATTTPSSAKKGG